MRRRAPVLLGQAVVFGPTTSPVPFAGSGGVSVAVELSPAGWARFGRRPAAELRDRVEPADAVLGADALGRGWSATACRSATRRRGWACRGRGWGA